MKKEFALSAFARPRSEDADYEYHAQSGMDLRDYFAAKAMQAILADQYANGLYVGDLDNDSEVVAANSAYIMADAMMKARKT